MQNSEPRPLRAITYLAPGIPLEFFQAVTGHLASALDRPVELVIESRISGPMHGDHDPFASGDADLGFVCSPSYLYLRAQRSPSVALVPAGFVFDDPRNGGRPLYFSEVVVRSDEPAKTICDLRGRTFGFNDRCSLSGYYATRQALEERCVGDGFFAHEQCTGSHSASIDAVLEGGIDVATIDSNVLAIERRRRPALERDLRVVESLGPHPIQPIVLRAALADELGSQIETALLELPRDPVAGEKTRAFGLRDCVPVDDELYVEERRILESLGQLSLRCS